MTGFYDPAPLGKPSFAGVLLTDAEVVLRIDVTLDWLRGNQEKLARMGFPEPVADTGERWDAEAVWSWQRAMNSINRRAPGPAPSAIGEVLGADAWPLAPPDTAGA